MQPQDVAVPLPWRMHSGGRRYTSPRGGQAVRCCVGESIRVDHSLSFLLLHEVPDDTKYKVINRIMMSVPVGGKAIFIEYHKPAWYSPWRYMMPIVYWLLEPLAFPVWNHQITELGDPNLVKKFKWKKELRFMGLYQKLVGIRVED